MLYHSMDQMGVLVIGKTIRRQWANCQNNQIFKQFVQIWLGIPLASQFPLIVLIIHSEILSGT